MKRGFTFIELLVVLAIVAVSVALTLPAISHSLQAAQAAQCRNNMKQIGLALHNYHDVFATFPPGWVSRDGGPGGGGGIGWQAHLLPFIDQSALYNRIDSHRPALDPAGKPQAPFLTVVNVYRCPSDPAPDVNPLRGGAATSNYTGNYGHLPTPRFRPLGMSDFWPGAVAAPMQTAGLFCRNSSVKIRLVTDGSSQTIMAGERGFSSGAGIWAGVTDNAHEDDAVTDGSHRSQINGGWFSFSSRHPGGANFLFADGSVRFLANGTESKPGPKLGLFQKLSCRNDGQVIADTQKATP